MPWRPPTIPRFGTTAAPLALVEPPELIRGAGFATSDQPPAQWMNYQFHVIGNWVDFLRDSSLSNWERGATPSTVNLISADTDALSVETTTPLHRLVSVDDSNTAQVWASVRGDPGQWKQCAVNLAAGSAGAPRALVFSGLYWVLVTWTSGSSTPAIFTTPPSGTAGSCIDTPSGDWVPASLPGATTEIDLIAARRDPVTGAGVELAAASQDHVLYCLDGGLTWSNATLSGAPAGVFSDVTWDGAAWLAITTHGEVYRATTAAATWTLVATIPTRANGYGLAADGAGNVVAFPRKDATADAWYTSTDHGATWAIASLTPTFAHLTRVRFLDSGWLLTSTAAPYLASANDLTSGWIRLPVPIVEGGQQGLQELAVADGAIVAMGVGFTLTSLRAEDPGPGTWVPSPAPSLLHDAAYLRGFLISGTAPTNGQVLVWNASTEQYEPGTAGLSNAIAGSFDFGPGSSHDYTADAGFTLAGYSAAVDTTALTMSDVLGDGVHVPFFHVLWRSASGAPNVVARTTTNTLRLQPSDALATADGYPFGDFSCAILIPLPPTEEIALDVTLAVNFGTISLSDSARGYLAVGGNLEAANSLFADGAAGFHWNTTSHQIEEEFGGVTYPATRSGATLVTPANAAFISGAVAKRRYRIALRNGILQILGAPTGTPTGTPSVVLRAEYSAAMRITGRKRYLIMAVAGSAPTTKSLYAEMSAFAPGGVRSYF